MEASHRITTLCYVINKKDNTILLAYKKRGFGQGKWNGTGGKGESIEEAAIRECKEEIGLTPVLKPRGFLDFVFINKEEWNQRCFVFEANEWEGTPIETEEMAPKWFPVNEIPYHLMWEDDIIWMPEMLQGSDVYYLVHFDTEGKMIRHKKLSPKGRDAPFPANDDNNISTTASQL